MDDGEAAGGAEEHVEPMPAVVQPGVGEGTKSSREFSPIVFASPPLKECLKIPIGIGRGTRTQNIYQQLFDESVHIQRHRVGVVGRHFDALLPGFPLFHPKEIMKVAAFRITHDYGKLPTCAFRLLFPESILLRITTTAPSIVVHGVQEEFREEKEPGSYFLHVGYLGRRFSDGADETVVFLLREGTLQIDYLLCNPFLEVGTTRCDASCGCVFCEHHELVDRPSTAFHNGFDYDRPMDRWSRDVQTMFEPFFVAFARSFPDTRKESAAAEDMGSANLWKSMHYSRVFSHKIYHCSLKGFRKMHFTKHAPYGDDEERCAELALVFAMARYQLHIALAEHRQNEDFISPTSMRNFQIGRMWWANKDVAYEELNKKLLEEE